MRFCAPDLPFFATVGWYVKQIAAVTMVYGGILLVAFLVLLVLSLIAGSGPSKRRR